jgi:hypothetical protein
MTRLAPPWNALRPDGGPGPAPPLHSSRIGRWRDGVRHPPRPKANCTVPLPPVLSLSCALPLLSFVCVMPFCSQARHEFYQSFFIDTIVHISVLNDNLSSERLIIFQRFGVHPMPRDFVRCEVSSFVTFENKS